MSRTFNTFGFWLDVFDFLLRLSFKSKTISKTTSMPHTHQKMKFHYITIWLHYITIWSVDEICVQSDSKWCRIDWWLLMALDDSYDSWYHQLNWQLFTFNVSPKKVPSSFRTFTTSNFHKIQKVRSVLKSACTLDFRTKLPFEFGQVEPEIIEVTTEVKWSG